MKTGPSVASPTTEAGTDDREAGMSAWVRMLGVGEPIAVGAVLGIRTSGDWRFWVPHPSQLQSRTHAPFLLTQHKVHDYY
jgi:hypothetical protein